jgi:transposase
MTQAEPLLERAHALADDLEQAIERLVADKGYDAEPLRELVRAWQIEPVIPYREPKQTKGKPKTTPPATPPIDWHSYKERHLIECFFNRIKHYRRIFTRFEKLASRYLGFLSFVAALVWLR